VTDELQPREWTIEFEDEQVTITDPDGRRGKPVPVPLKNGDLASETLLALTWYVLTTSEDQCQSRLLELLGRYLFELIFPIRLDDKDDRDLIVRRQRFSVHCEAPPGVRLNLRFAHEMPRYAQLPWEFLCVETRNGPQFLADLQGVNVTLTRFLSTQRQLTRCDPPVKVLVHVSEPSDKAQISYGDLENELKSLRQRAAGKFDFLLRKDATLEEIRKDLKDYEPHVFHFSGHGEKDGFWLANRDRASARKLAEEVGMSRRPFGFAPSVSSEVFKASIEAISGLFKIHQPRLVVLDACRSDWSWLSEMLPGVAHQLVTSVPAVIAMRYPISNSDATTFSLALYKGIAEGEPLDMAVQVARNELRSAEADKGSSRAFGTPVLYLKGRAEFCERLIEAQESVDGKADASSNLRRVQAEPCPRCHGAGLWKKNASKCARCGIYFRCRNKDCAGIYDDSDILVLRFCPYDCGAKYDDCWPYTRPGSTIPHPSSDPLSSDGPVLPSWPSVGLSGPDQQDLITATVSAPPRQLGLTLASSGPGSKFAPEPRGVEELTGRSDSTDQVTPI
jgi:hypothetical protein